MRWETAAAWLLLTLSRGMISVDAGDASAPGRSGSDIGLTSRPGSRWHARTQSRGAMIAVSGTRRIASPPQTPSQVNAATPVAVAVRQHVQGRRAQVAAVGC